MINTSSGNGGVSPLPSTPQYAVTKAAVVTLTECLYAQLSAVTDKVTASVLFPGPNMLRTGLFESWRFRPERFAKTRERKTPYVTVEQLEEQMRAAGVEPAYTEPAEVADQVIKALKSGAFWILPESDRIDETIRAQIRVDARKRKPDVPRFGPRTRRSETMTSEKPYTVISADSHAGLPTEQYRGYLEQKYWPQFDEFLAGPTTSLRRHPPSGRVRRKVRKAMVRRAPTRVSKVAGTPRDATRRWMPTGSPPRSSSPTPMPSRAAPAPRSVPGSASPAITTRSWASPAPALTTAGWQRCAPTPPNAARAPLSYRSLLRSTTCSPRSAVAKTRDSRS